MVANGGSELLTFLGSYLADCFIATGWDSIHFLALTLKVTSQTFFFSCEFKKELSTIVVKPYNKEMYLERNIIAGNLS